LESKANLCTFIVTPTKLSISQEFYAQVVQYNIIFIILLQCS